LNTHQNPGGYQSNEHYCRRWISIGVIEELKKSKNKSIDQSVVAIQKSKFINSNDEYLSISIAKPSRIKPDTYSSVTLGFLIDNDLLKKVNMLNDTKIKSREVNDTCENCGVLDCKERVSEPHSLENKRVKENIKSAIKELTATK